MHRTAAPAIVAVIFAVLSAPATRADFRTAYLPMLQGRNGATVTAIHTVGEPLPSRGVYVDAPGVYVPVGIPDGIGAFALDERTVRVLVNHELSAEKGYPYRLRDGATLTGARVSYYDIDRASRRVIDAGLAYGRAYDRRGQAVTRAEQLNETGDPRLGFSRFCSSALFEPDGFGPGRGFADRVYFTGEEVGRPNHPHGGTLWALEVSTGQIWAAPAPGRGQWENVTQVDSGRADRVALLMGDDSEGAPLYLWVGHKQATGSFLERNGLAEGALYAWKADATGVNVPSKFHGTGSRQVGTFVKVTVRDPARKGTPGYDADGYADSDTLRRQADALGAFSFARPEDLATHPRNGSQVVFASTGRDKHDAGSDSWGTLYTVDLDLGAIDRPTATVKVLYDGNADPDRRLRSPDNLDWADDGGIYVQEDRSFAWEIDPSPTEASVVRVDPTTGALQQVAEMDRSALAPLGGTDRLAGRLGAWESSGILDVSSLFGSAPGTLFLLTVQAHGIQDGVIGGDALLVQGGQLLFLDTSRLSATRPGAVAVP